MTLLTTYRDTSAKIAARHRDRTTKEQELMGLKTDTEARLQMNQLRELQERLLVEIDQKLAEVRVPQPETHMVFRGNFGHLEQLIASVGELLEEEVPIVPRYDKMRPVVAIVKNGQASEELWYPKGIAINEKTNLIYVADGAGSRKVSIFSMTGAFMNTFTHEDMREPRGIAIYRDNLYVSDMEAHAVFQFKIQADMRLIAKLGILGSGIGQFNCPYGLTVSTYGDVFVADRSNNRIKVLDHSLNFQRFITHQTMVHPYDVKLTPNEVYVLCCISPCMLVFSHAGEKLRSLITQGKGMQIKSADYFCLDSKENSLISDWGNNQIRIFSKEGTRLHTIGGPGGEVGMFFNPRGIVITKNSNLIIVSRNYNYTLQIFASQL